MKMGYRNSHVHCWPAFIGTLLTMCLAGSAEALPVYYSGPDVYLEVTASIDGVELIRDRLPLLEPARFTGGLMEADGSRFFISDWTAAFAPGTFSVPFENDILSLSVESAWHMAWGRGNGIGDFDSGFVGQANAVFYGSEVFYSASIPGGLIDSAKLGGGGHAQFIFSPVTWDRITVSSGTWFLHTANRRIGQVHNLLFTAQVMQTGSVVYRPVPEPSTTFLLGLGLAFLAFQGSIRPSQP